MWHLVEHVAHYHVPEIHINRFNNKKLRRPGISPKIVVFTEGPCSGPPSGGAFTPSSPILHVFVDGHNLYATFGLVSSNHAIVRGYGTPNFEKTSKIGQISPLPPQ